MTEHARPRTLVVGLGNPILGDDGVGWRIAELVAEQLRGRAQDVEVDCVALGGLSLMERMIGYDRVVLADAITTGAAPAGAVSSFPLAHLADTAASHSRAAHDTSLQTAMQVGRTMGAQLPEDVHVVAVEAQCLGEFTVELSPAVAAAVPVAARMVLQHLCLED